MNVSRSTHGRTARTPDNLAVAVFAVELAQTLEWLAGEFVASAREDDGATWEDVGAAFGTTMQSAYARFRDRS
jgi:hypothetical protein